MLRHSAAAAGVAVRVGTVVVVALPPPPPQPTATRTRSKQGRDACRMPREYCAACAPRLPSSRDPFDAGRGDRGALRRAARPSPPRRSPARRWRSTRATTAATTPTPPRSTGSWTRARSASRATRPALRPAGGYTRGGLQPRRRACGSPRILRAQGARVVLTRTTDTGWGPCITERAAIGNRAHADAAISIHADGGPASGRGFHVIYPPSIARLTDDIAAASRRLAVAVRNAFAAGHRRAVRDLRRARRVSTFVPTSAGSTSRTCRRCSSRRGTCETRSTRGGWSRRPIGSARPKRSRAGSRLSCASRPPARQRRSARLEADKDVGAGLPLRVELERPDVRVRERDAVRARKRLRRGLSPAFDLASPELCGPCLDVENLAAEVAALDRDDEAVLDDHPVVRARGVARALAFVRFQTVLLEVPRALTLLTIAVPTSEIPMAYVLPSTPRLVARKQLISLWAVCTTLQAMRVLRTSIVSLTLTSNTRAEAA